MIDFKAEKTVVGYHIVQGPQPLQHRCPSYYAADSQTYFEVPGRYPITLRFEYAGWIRPMPKLGVYSDCYAVETTYYSGFGGVNFASSKEGPQPTYPCSFSPHTLDRLVATHQAELLPGFEFLADPDYGKILDTFGDLWIKDIERRLDANPDDWYANNDLRKLVNKEGY